MSAKNATKTNDVDQNGRPVIFERLDRVRDQLRTSGAVVSSFRTYKGRRLGPYFRVAYRVDGRQRAIFIGGDPELVQKVRDYLRALQSSRHQKVAMDRARRAAARQLAANLLRFDRELTSVGLRRRGSQIIGWRAWKRNWIPPSLHNHRLDACNGVPNGVESTSS